MCRTRFLHRVSTPIDLPRFSLCFCDHVCVQRHKDLGRHSRPVTSPSSKHKKPDEFLSCHTGSDSVNLPSPPSAAPNEEIGQLFRSWSGQVITTPPPQQQPQQSEAPQAKRRAVEPPAPPAPPASPPVTIAMAIEAAQAMAAKGVPVFVIVMPPK